MFDQVEGRVIPIAFDLDGTLVHSVPDLHLAANAFLARHGKAPLELSTVQGFVGDGVPRLVERIAEVSGLPAGPIDLARFVEEFSSIYQADPVGLTTVYPGVREALDALSERGHRLSICTNKPEEPTRAILEHFGLGALFPVVIGGDTLTVRKPDPAPLRAALGDRPGLFVGDSEVDAATASAGAIPFLLFTQGYRKSPVADLDHYAAFTRFADLARLVETALGPA